MLKILQARLQQYVNWEIPNWIYKKQRNQRSNCQCLLDHRKSKRIPEKSYISASLTMHKVFDYADHNKMENSERDGNTRPPDLPPELLNAGQEATVRTGHGTTDLFQIRKWVRQGCILLPWLFNLYAEYIMHHARLNEAQGGIKIARRNINNLRYADDTTVVAESEEN